MTEPSAGPVEMWEAKAVPGAGAALVAWVWDHVRSADPASKRVDGSCQVFRSGDRVVVILPMGTDDPRTQGSPGSPAMMPEPPAELVARRPHRWRFDRVAPPNSS